MNMYQYTCGICNNFHKKSALFRNRYMYKNAFSTGEGY